MKKTILILLTVLLAVSCSQVVYDNLPPADISADNVSFQVKRASGMNNTLKIIFTPVAYVSTYGYQIDDNDSVAISSGDFGYENGYITYDVISDDFSNTGVISLLSMSEEGDTVIGTANYSFLTTDSISPNVFVSSRFENSVELYVSANDPSVEYKITVADKESSTEEKEYTDIKANNGFIQIYGLLPDHEYTLTVAHKMEDDANYGSNTTELYIDKYLYDVVISLEATDSSFTAFDIPEGINSVELRKKTDSQETSKDILSADVNNGTAVFNFANMKSLESGIFYVYAEDTSGTYISNTVRATTPITVKKMYPNYRSVNLCIDFADEIKGDSTVKFSVNDIPNAFAVMQDFTSKEGYDVLTISGIDSNTTYDQISFSANKPGDFAILSEVSDIRTKSFAGISGQFYEWDGRFGTGTDTRFVIYVCEAPEGSDFPYYVYFSENDPSMNGKIQNYERSTLRIMPLIDNSKNLENREPETSESLQVNCSDGHAGEYNLTSQNEAYEANSLKWNKMRDKVDLLSWYIIDGDMASQNDIVTTHTRTKATMDLGFTEVTVPSDTYTSFYFMENDIDGDGVMDPFIKFVNTGDTFAQMGLETNAEYSTEWKMFESSEPADLEYTFYLSPVDITEGGAE